MKICKILYNLLPQTIIRNFTDHYMVNGNICNIVIGSMIINFLKFKKQQNLNT